jgi:hypothetical protein
MSQQPLRTMTGAARLGLDSAGWVVSQPLTLRIAFAICVLLFLATAPGCDPGATIKYVNETDKTVIVYTADDRDLSDYDVIVEAYSTVRAGTIITEFKDVVVLRDKDGNLLLRKEITWDELKAQDFRFVITEDMLSPTPTESR